MLRHGFSGIEKCSSILEQPWLKFSNEVVEDNVEVEDDRIDIVKDLVIVIVLVLARIIGRGRSRCYCLSSRSRGKAYCDRSPRHRRRCFPCCRNSFPLRVRSTSNNVDEGGDVDILG